MKRVGYITDKDGRRITLLEAMGDYGNVQKAYNKARKCKRHRKDVLIFTKDKEENIEKQSRLIADLIATLESWEQTAGYDGAELKERAENLQLRERQDL